jgi:hypothetical protein
MLHETRKARSGGWSTLGAVPNRTQKFIAINEDTSFALADHDNRCHRKRHGGIEESCVMGLCDFRRAANRDQPLGNTRVDGLPRISGGRFEQSSDQYLVAGVETATSEKQVSALGATLDAATNVMRSTRWSAAVRAVSFAVVRSSQIRLALQKKDCLHTSDPRAS